MQLHIGLCKLLWKHFFFFFQSTPCIASLHITTTLFKVFLLWEPLDCMMSKADNRKKKKKKKNLWVRIQQDLNVLVERNEHVYVNLLTLML
jgi:hypothetical protein